MINIDLSIKKNNLHHAYCILGNAKDVMSELKKLFQEKLNFYTENNPDFWYGKYDVMDIEDGRTIKNLHQNRPTKGDKKIFVVSANFITEKAQNAMLKLFEEPRGDTHFFLVIPTLNNIIPTFRSRLFIIDTKDADNRGLGTQINADKIFRQGLKNDEFGGSIINTKEFLKMPIGERMEAVKTICESISHEKPKGLVASDEEESKIEVIKFINALEVALHADLRGLDADKRRKILKEKLALFEEIEKVRLYAGEQSPSLKMLLEHISLMLP